MASVSAPRFPSPTTYADRNPHKFGSAKFAVSPSRCSPPLKRTPIHSSSRPSDSAVCRCQNRSSSPSPADDYVHGGWDSFLQDVVKKAIKRFDDYKNSYWNQSKTGLTIDAMEREKDSKEVDDWDWDRWKKHFKEVEEQERIVSVLKSQLVDAIYKEDYEEAAKLKVAIAAAATNDTVGKVTSHFNRAIKEERYQDAARLRDYAGAGLVGWWAGISEGSGDPYGRIIRITAEHGRYVAKSYSPRQLATATDGVPLFEIYLAMNDKGEYRQQAVYLKQNRGSSGSSPKKSSSRLDASSSLNESAEGKDDISSTITEDTEEDGDDRDDDFDAAEGLSGFQNILQDMIPGVKVKVLKVTSQGKVDRDIISKVIEQIMEEEDEENDMELDIIETEDTDKAEKDQDGIEMNDDSGVSEDRSEMAVNVVIGGLVQLSNNVPSKDLLRVPARLEKKGRLSFSFSIEKDGSRQQAGSKGKASPAKNDILHGQRSIDRIMSDLAKFIITREKIPMKVLKDVGELINLTLNQTQNHQLLSGPTTFNRIEIPTSSDPLTGLYIGAHGLYTSEVIHLRRKFGQWQEDGGTQKVQNLEFYEYVEAIKLTGDPYVPAGQVAFRAKVGKRNQLPHKGIIPEEFGVVARYRGQGRLAEPGFRNPRWVDGELVILNGKVFIFSQFLVHSMI
uniref:Protein EXECUTER 1, chloroplastic n=1 Tax=Nelumbo nucifera TaxID=4432 RepID=A0A822Z8L8_NELNU|nr:TPA_asm: hypothetical protein HUJ06_015263 [Nelumbo nucifera]